MSRSQIDTFIIVFLIRFFYYQLYKNNTLQISMGNYKDKDTLFQFALYFIFDTLRKTAKLETFMWIFSFYQLCYHA